MLELAFSRADVLLPRGEREHIAGLAVYVLRLTDDAAGKLARHGGGRRHKTEVGAAESSVEPEGLTVAHSDVSAHLMWSRQKSTGDGVHAHNKLRTRGVDELADGPCIFDLTEVVRLLEIEARGVLAERGLERVGVGPAILCGNDGQLGV